MLFPNCTEERENSVITTPIYLDIFFLLLLVSTIFLASGMIWPEWRNELWFLVSFFLCRILFVIAILHEGQFNIASPTGSTSVYALALAVHVYWFWKYFQGVKRRTMRKEKEEGKDGGHKETGKDKATSSTAVRKTIHLRAMSTSAKSKK